MKYGILNQTTGKLLSLCWESNEGKSFCNDKSFWLVEDDYYPLYLVDNVEDVFSTLQEEIPWYNSSEETPSLHKSIKADYKVAKVDTIIRYQYMDSDSTDSLSGKVTYFMDDPNKRYGYKAEWSDKYPLPKIGQKFTRGFNCPLVVTEIIGDIRAVYLEKTTIEYKSIGDWNDYV